MALTRKYRYVLRWPGNAQDVYPLDKDLVIEYKQRDTNKVQFQRELAGDLTFVNDARNGVNDFDIFTSFTGCGQFWIDVYKLSYSTSTPYITGTFSAFEGEYDLDHCEVRFSPKPADENNCIEDNADEEINIVSYQDAQTVSFLPSVYDLLFEKRTVTAGKVKFARFSVTDVTTIVPFGVCYIPDGIDLDQLKNVTLFSDLQGWHVEYLIVTNIEQPWGTTGDFIGDVEVHFIRGYVITIDNPDGTAFNPNDTLFEQHSATTLDGLPAHKFTAIYLYEYANPTFDYTITLEFFGATCLDHIYRYDLIVNTNLEVQTLKTWQRLTDVISMFAENCNLTVQSDFFNAILNPLLDSQVYPYNPLNDVCIIPAYNIYRLNILQGFHLTKLMLSFQDLMRELFDLFQVCYFADYANSQLIVEHISYFENGFTYTGTPAVQIDLTQQQYNKYLDFTNKYSYRDSQVPKVENFRFWGAAGVEFIGLPITYSCVGRQQLLHENAVITPDINAVYTYRTPDNLFGKLVIACIDSFNTPDPTTGYNVSFGTGEILDSWLQNGFLTRSNLHDKFWRHSRYNLYGRLNGSDVTFTTMKKLKKQIPFSFPINGMVFTPYELVTTYLGNGETVQATENLATETLEITLAYD